jgi:2-amino-4-hydroxy-6-hydroxymethyldihydropteridine diphosphokinase
MNRVVIGVGSNIEPEHSISEAKNILAKEHHLLRCTSWVQTKAIGFLDQPDFLNGAFLIETHQGLEDFKIYLKDLEKRLGRVKTENKFGPRVIDLDILIWNKKVIDTDVYERPFVRNAVLELIPDFNIGLSHEL